MTVFGTWDRYCYYSIAEFATTVRASIEFIKQYRGERMLDNT